MRALAILTFQTLDGVMQAPTSPEEDPSDGFTKGGWAVSCWDEVMEQVKGEAMAEPYDLLFGRKTYDMFAQSFSSQPGDDPVAQKLHNARKYVVTSKIDGLDWQHTTPILGDVVEGITKLKSQDGPLLQVHGSWQLIQLLLANDLVDEFRLWTFPVIVGSGKRLFTKAIPVNMALLKSGSCRSGATMGIYRRR